MCKYILNILLLVCFVSCKSDKGKDMPEIDLRHSVVLDEKLIVAGQSKRPCGRIDSCLLS